MGECAMFSGLKAIVGSEHVLTGQQTIAAYARSTLPKSTTPLCIVRPGCAEEVARLVAWAGTSGTPLYPISRGKNWGYGDACAVQDRHIILDLSRMNRIVEVNVPLAYAVIEPGVTQQQLYDHLKANNIPLCFDCTGSGPQASVAGNIMDRGFGHTPYGDHFLNSAGMEVVLPDGRIMHTGYGHYENATAAHVYKWGIGPYFDGLFTQSNLGIVTRLGIWLMPVSERVETFFYSVPREADIHAIIEKLRPLRLSGVIRSTVHIANDLRVVSSFRRYPWELTGGKTPLPEKIRQQLCRQGGFGAWNVTGALYGSNAQVAAARKEIKSRIRGVRFVGPKLMTLASMLRRLLDKMGIGKDFVGMLLSLQEVYNLVRGTPSELFMYGTLWRTRDQDLSSTSNDPLDNNAGVMWISPILPMTGEHTRRVLDIIYSIFSEYGFEPLITISLITERALVAVTTICYDKNNSEEVGRAENCCSHLLDALMDAGYIPYRFGIQSMSKLSRNSSVFWDVVGEIKKTLDPANILSRGRYLP